MNKETIDIVAVLTNALVEKQVECDALSARVRALENSAHTYPPEPEMLETVIKQVACMIGYDDDDVDGLIEGKTYDVVEIAGNGNYRLKGQRSHCYWGPYRFRDVTSENVTPITLKKVKCMDVGWADKTLSHGKEYDVILVCDDEYLLRDVDGWWDKDRFVDVEPTVTPVPTIKKVRCIDNHDSYLVKGKVYDVIHIMGSNTDHPYYNFRGVGKEDICWWKSERFIDVAEHATLKKVRCIDTQGYTCLTKGKVYDVIRIDGCNYHLRGVDSNPPWWDRVNFIDVVEPKKVRCIDDKCTDHNLREGQVYTVVEANGMEYQLDGNLGWWFADRFVDADQ